MSTDTEFLRDGFLGRSTALRRLQLQCGWSQVETARALLVSPETYRRWRRDRPANPTAVKLLAVLAGYVPWSGWQGWEVHRGYLFPPGYSRHGIEPADLYAIPFVRQLVSEYQRKVRELEAERRRLGLGASGEARS